MSDNTSPAINSEFQSALAAHPFELNDEQILALQRYAELLWDWNSKLNLTRHTDFQKFTDRDLLDSWQVASQIEPDETVLDVGSGGGVPGIPLAIMRPDLEVSLCESVGKKALALNEMVSELNLPIVIHNARVEDVVDEMRFDVLIARAVGPLWKIGKWLEPHWKAFDRLLAIKGPRWVDERKEARHRGFLQKVDLRRVLSYPMPDSESESVILQLSAKS